MTAPDVIEVVAAGDITVIEVVTGTPGPPGTLDVVELTQAAYDALFMKNPNTIYVIV